MPGVVFNPPGAEQGDTPGTGAIKSAASPHNPRPRSSGRAQAHRRAIDPSGPLMKRKNEWLKRLCKGLQVGVGRGLWLGGMSARFGASTQDKLNAIRGDFSDCRQGLKGANSRDITPASRDLVHNRWRKSKCGNPLPMRARSYCSFLPSRLVSYHSLCLAAKSAWVQFVSTQRPSTFRQARSLNPRLWPEAAKRRGPLAE
jgi:hypothetical protein